MTIDASRVRLLVLGDVHDHQPRLRRALEWVADRGEAPDAVLLVGDIAGDPSWERRAHPDELARMAGDIDRIAEQVSTATGAPVAFVPGNHDPRVVEHPGNLDRRLGALAGLSVYGVGGAGPGRWGLPYEWDEAEIAALDVPRCDVLLAHAPPRETRLDRLAGTQTPLGSAALADHARRHRGLYVCGHIHEGFGADELGGALCLNAGGLGEPHGAARLVWVEATRGPWGPHDWRWAARLVDLDHHVDDTLTHWSLRGPPAEVYRRTPTFTQDSLPKALRTDHSTKDGVWGRLVVERGGCELVFGPELRLHCAPGLPGDIPPQVPHHVRITGPCHLHVEFRRPA